MLWVSLHSERQMDLEPQGPGKPDFSDLLFYALNPLRPPDFSLFVTTSRRNAAISRSEAPEASYITYNPPIYAPKHRILPSAVIHQADLTTSSNGNASNFSLIMMRSQKIPVPEGFSEVFQSPLPRPKIQMAPNQAWAPSFCQA